MQRGFGSQHPGFGEFAVGGRDEGAEEGSCFGDGDDDIGGGEQAAVFGHGGSGAAAEASEVPWQRVSAFWVDDKDVKFLGIWAVELGSGIDFLHEAQHVGRGMGVGVWVVAIF